VSDRLAVVKAYVEKCKLRHDELFLEKNDSPKALAEWMRAEAALAYAEDLLMLRTEEAALASLKQNSDAFEAQMLVVMLTKTCGDASRAARACAEAVADQETAVLNAQADVTIAKADVNDAKSDVAVAKAAITVAATRLDRWQSVVDDAAFGITKTNKKSVKIANAKVERDRAVAQRDRAVTQRDRAVAQRDRAVAQRDRAVAHRDRADNKLADAAMKLADAKATLAAAETKLADAKTQVQGAKVAAGAASKSVVGAPLLAEVNVGALIRPFVDKVEQDRIGFGAGFYFNDTDRGTMAFALLNGVVIVEYAQEVYKLLPQHGDRLNLVEFSRGVKDRALGRLPVRGELFLAVSRLYRRLVGGGDDDVSSTAPPTSLSTSGSSPSVVDLAVSTGGPSSQAGGQVGSDKCSNGLPLSGAPADVVSVFNVILAEIYGDLSRPDRVAVDWLYHMLERVCTCTDAREQRRLVDGSQMRFTVSPFLDAVRPLFYAWGEWKFNSLLGKDESAISESETASCYKSNDKFHDAVVLNKDGTVGRIIFELSKPDSGEDKFSRNRKKLVRAALDSVLCGSTHEGEHRVMTEPHGDFVLVHTIRNEGTKLIVSALEPFEPHLGTYWMVDIASLNFVACSVTEVFQFAMIVARLHDSLTGSGGGGGGGGGGGVAGGGGRGGVNVVQHSREQTKPRTKSVFDVRVAAWSSWTRVHVGKRATVWRDGDRVRRVARRADVGEAATMRQQFLHELGAAHNAAVPLFDSWLDVDGSGVLGGASVVFEMAAGEPLEMGELTDNEFEKLSLSMLECVARLHGAGAVHVDIKPQNFVVLNGEARLIDFESAILLAVGEPYVEVADVLCTRAFAAPELYEGDDNRDNDGYFEPALVGRPADAFALGRSLEKSRQARDVTYARNGALRKMIRCLCRETATDRWTVARALERWRAVVSSAPVRGTPTHDSHVRTPASSTESPECASE
jgi:hypothetical protein